MIHSDLHRGERPGGEARTMSGLLFRNGTVILPDRLLEGATVRVEGGRIVGIDTTASTGGGEVVDLAGGYLSPGYIDIHVHGGDDSDFMDGTPEAFQTVCRA